MTITWQELRDARTIAELTQAELAEKLGVHQKTIANWESRGVPKKEEYRVMRVLSPQISHIREEEVIRRFRGTPEGQANLERDLRQWDANHEFQAKADAGELLSLWSDEALLRELLKRAESRGAAGPGGVIAFRPATVGPDLHTMHIEEERYAADENNKGPDEDLRQP